MRIRNYIYRLGFQSETGTIPAELKSLSAVYNEDGHSLEDLLNERLSPLGYRAVENWSKQQHTPIAAMVEELCSRKRFDLTNWKSIPREYIVIYPHNIFPLKQAQGGANEKV